MKLTLVLILLTSPFWAGATVADSWSWLDHPEKQEWSQVTIKGYERQISFAIPDKRKRGHPVIRVPLLERGLIDQVVEVAPEVLRLPGYRIIGFDWERRWGGFFKGDITDYTLRVLVTHVGEDANLLSLPVPERMQRVRDEFYNLYAGLGNAEESEAFFFERFKIGPHKSNQEYIWTMENSPTGVKEQEYFRLPFTDNRELIFWFYYRWELHGGNDDTGWLERRRALSRKILDTVRIEPDPYR